MEKITVSELIKLYDLQPHPEGGYFKETYRSLGCIPASVLPAQYKSQRHYSTAIYFLLPETFKSTWHRLRSDEIWHFYLGGPLTLLQIAPGGATEKIVMGRDIKVGQKLQQAMPAGFWFGAYPNLGSDYSFVGCTVAPGFDFTDFETASCADLVKKFPKNKKFIEELAD